MCPAGAPERRRQAGAWGLFLVVAGLLALFSPVMTTWWGVTAVVGGLAAFVIQDDRRSMLLTAASLWLLAVTGLPIAGRPAPLLSTALAFAGTKAYRGWSAHRREDRADTGLDEPPQQPGRVSAGLLLGGMTWLAGIVAAVSLSGTWAGRFQIFPGLDIALTGAQVGTAAGLTAAIDSPRSRLAVLIPFGVSIISLSMLFWLFFLAP
jgi:hypothetical protein